MSASTTGIVREMALKARKAAAALAETTAAVKNAALIAMADRLEKNKAALQGENQRDMDAGAQAGLSTAMLGRLELTDKVIAQMANSLRQVARLPDPVGEIFDMVVRPNGMRLGRMRMPFGVIGIIYESRPNVTADAGGLCIKSGNAVILRGGSEAIHSNRKIASLMAEAGAGAGLPDGALQLIPSTDRALVIEMVKLEGLIDLIIPRGGRQLIEMIMQHSSIPVIKHLDGNCFVYVDDDADLAMAREIVLNAKVQRPGVCNAMETLLVHSALKETFLPEICRALADKGVEIRGDERVRQAFPQAKSATGNDWRAEYLDLILAVGVVDSFDEAVDKINAWGSHHTDSIVTRDHRKAMRFLSAVDSGCVFVNASTRLSDGEVFGLGCEVGISTDKLHARGPMGLRELTTAKFILLGDGHVRT
ncbi:MAG: glutamate-5-semialdehyde dehydrogenase [Candidatus Sumerlaeota bacterium]|nr:glutamate-5-semialdehyde dehydrogenase [Candidatus Sumerlaeota bacterium]